MGTLSTALYLIDCDGCGRTYGAPHGFPSVTEARAAAYADGWRPNQISSKGVALRNTSDACPECMPDWKPQTSRSRQRVLTRAEADGMRRDALAEPAQQQGNPDA